jgi:DNA-binding response OmpR family regulator
MQLAVYETEDDLFAQLVVSAARRRGHTAKCVDSIDAIKGVFVASPSAIIMGVSKIDARALADLRALRGSHNGSLIYLAVEDGSARPIMSALEVGATDVMHKPILPSDLVIRAELAAMNRGTMNQRDGAIRVSDLEVDVDQARATKAGHELPLTRMELRLLYCLAQHRGRVAPTERLIAFARETDDSPTSSLKTHMSHLRQKLSQAGGQPVAIRARQMLGYILDIEDES